MRNVVKVILIAAFTLAAAHSGNAQVRLYGGKYSDPDKWFAGAGFEIGVIPIIKIIPSYEYVFTDVGHFYTLSVDGTINFLVVGYAGAGVGWNFMGGGGADSRNSTALNILAGVDLNRIPLSPFAQVKYVSFSQGGSTWSFGVGIHI
ncbi:MAG TPA: hypothetical protein VK569_00045 [Bacteroidota bacterium]|nr:hypothetical protein [Bacteroidota bacterium]